jgi:hypothetical protein
MLLLTTAVIDACGVKMRTLSSGHYGHHGQNWRNWLASPAGFLLPIVFVALTVALVAPAKAEERLDGSYQCVQLEFQGHSAPCQSPPLVLNRNGSYEIWGEHGSYEVVQGHWLVLSHSKRRGMGHFLNAHDIVFEYRVDGRICRVTFRRVFDAPPGFRWG